MIKFFKLSIRSHRRRQAMLKAEIRHRLATEDYTCRLPKVKVIKPYVRYKLRLQRHPYPWHKTWVYC